MKGLVMMLAALLLLTSVIIIAAFTPIGKNAAEAAKTFAKSYASEISGAINIMEMTPGDSAYVYQNMPSGDCKIYIGREVTVDLGQKGSASVGTIESSVTIKPATLSCSDTKSISIEKNNNIITARSA